MPNAIEEARSAIDDGIGIVDSEPERALGRAERALELLAGAKGAVRVDALLLASRAHAQLGDRTGARRRAEDAVAGCDPADPVTHAKALAHLGHVEIMHGRPGAAEEPLRRALAAARESGADTDTMTRVLLRLAAVCLQGGRSDEARALADEGLDIAGRAGLIVRQAELLGLRGDLDLGDGRYAEAHEWYTEAVAAARRARKLQLEARALMQCGRALTQMESFTEAFRCYEQAIHIQRTETFLGELPYTLANCAVAQQRAGESAAAMEGVREALDLARTGEKLRLEAYCLRLLADLHREAGDRDEALAFAERAVAICEETGDRLTLSASLRGLGEIRLDQGDHDRARDAFAQSANLMRDGASTIEHAFARMGLGHVAARRGDETEALAHLDAALELAGEDRRAIVRIHEARAEVFEHLGDTGRALAELRLQQEIEGDLRRKTAAARRSLASLKARTNDARADPDATELRVRRRYASRERAILEHAPGVAVRAYDVRGTVRLWSAGAEELLGWSREEAVGRPDGGIEEKTLRELDATQAGIGPLETEFRTKSGEVGTALTTMFPIVGESGERLFVRMDVDVTARAEAQRKLREAEQEIRRLNRQLSEENLYLREEVRQAHDFDEIVGESEAIVRVLKQVEHVAPTDATVLLLGETGTGKELIARAVHARSRRKDHPLIKVNCAALPATLVESELFGHEKGAFTGAQAQHRGRFELAHRGTIFLDEIGEMPPDIQVKLLRVLQDGEIQRLGSTKPRTVDVRVIAATNRELRQAVKDGRFREDLFYRLATFPLEIPPLRERRGDIALLVSFFVTRLKGRLGRDVRTIPRPVMEELESYGWPGNIRELRGVIERALILAEGPALKLAGPLAPVVDRGQRPRTVAENERRFLIDLLEECGWRVKGPAGAAERAGLPPSTLRNRMKKLGIRRPKR